MAEEGFLRRWARLKAQPEAEVPAPAPANAPAPAAPADVALAADAAPVPPRAYGAGGDLGALGESGQQRAPLTLADAAALHADDDFSQFVASNVDAAVRRLAMKKLFADPHFHGHDGLDIYMGDYNLPSPVSDGMLADMSHNKKLFARLDNALEGMGDAPAPAPLGPTGAQATAGGAEAGDTMPDSMSDEGVDDREVDAHVDGQDHGQVHGPAAMRDGVPEARHDDARDAAHEAAHQGGREGGHEGGHERGHEGGHERGHERGHDGLHGQ